jgi:type IV secretory pathway component VirB8
LERNETIDEIPFQDKNKYRDRLRENWDLRRKRSAGASEGFIKRILISFIALAVLAVIAVYYLG